MSGTGDSDDFRAGSKCSRAGLACPGVPLATALWGKEEAKVRCNGPAQGRTQMMMHVCSEVQVAK